MNLKNKRKKLKIKYIIYLILFYLFFSFSFVSLMKNNTIISNETFIKLLLSGSNYQNIYDIKLTNIVNKTVKLITNIDLTKPNTILNYTILKNDSTNKQIELVHNDDYSNIEELKKISSYIEDPYKIDVNNPIIYIYNTHQLENYNNKNLEIYNITPNVLMASYILKEKLNRLGVSTIVEETNLTEFLNLNNWTYASSYKATRLLLIDTKNQYDSLSYYIDLHRDSVSRNITTVEIDGKSYAKILFVIGLEHDKYKENLAVTTKLNNLIINKYPNLSRGIYKKEGPGVDGVYNQDIDKNVMLIEIGGVDNTIEEVFNTIEALSIVLSEFVGGD